RRGVQALGGHRREDLPLVAEPPRPDALALEVRDRGDAGVGEGDLQRPRPLEDLRDVREVGALLDRAQHLRHPCDAEVDVAAGQRGTMSPPEGTISTSRPSSAKKPWSTAAK